LMREILSELNSLFNKFKKERLNKENFGKFYNRTKSN